MIVLTVQRLFCSVQNRYLQSVFTQTGLLKHLLMALAAVHSVIAYNAYNSMSGMELPLQLLPRQLHSLCVLSLGLTRCESCPGHKCEGDGAGSA